MIEKQHPPYKIAIFRTDSEPTIVENSTWKEWLEKEGIVHEVAAPLIHKTKMECLKEGLVYLEK